VYTCTELDLCCWKYLCQLCRHAVESLWSVILRTWESVLLGRNEQILDTGPMDTLWGILSFRRLVWYEKIILSKFCIVSVYKLPVLWALNLSRDNFHGWSIAVVWEAQLSILFRELLYIQKNGPLGLIDTQHGLSGNWRGIAMSEALCSYIALSSV